MRRLMSSLRYVLPLALAATGAVIKLVAGQGGIEMMLVLLAGGLLGWAIVLALESASALGGFFPESSGDLSPDRAAMLERQRAQTLEAISEIRLDAELRKIAPAEAEKLTAPLEAQAGSLAAALEELRQGGSRSVEQEIEVEISRRLAAEEEAR